MRVVPKDCKDMLAPPAAGDSQAVWGCWEEIIKNLFLLLIGHCARDAVWI